MFRASGYAYEQLRELAGRYVEMSDDEHLRTPVTPLFVNAWAIVDNTHLVRSLLRRSRITGQPVMEFITRTEVATRLRNKFDHVGEMVGNLARKSDPMALFGALSIHHVCPEHIDTTGPAGPVLKGYHLVQVHAGRPVTMLHDLEENDGKPFAIERPVGRFLLQAFDLKANLSELVFNTRAVVEFYDDVIGPRVAKQVREAAKRQGLDPDKELLNTGLGVVWHARVQFLAEASEDPDPAAPALGVQPI